MNLSEISLDFDDIGNWPMPVRMVSILVAALLVVGAGYYFDTQDQLVQLETEQKKEIEHKRTFEIKQRKASQLDDYREQLVQIEDSLGVMLKQLPDKTEIAKLLVDISQTGLGNGLEFELFQPKGEQKREFYAEYPIDVRVIGDYLQLGNFVSGVAAFPRIVTISDVQIQPHKKSGKLVMQAVVKTYRYLDDEEIAQKAAANKKRKRKR
ncbi:MAG TPA: pilus assembly protein PilO [Crenotrichaceae bacterium]|nr:pilus assembly protein PilO [Crenotrichaceae bacterium]